MADNDPTEKPNLSDAMCVVEKKSELPKDPRPYFDVGQWAEKVVQKRKNPLLVMFYSDVGSIDLMDTEYLEHVLSNKKFKELDLIIHTRGGDVSGSYLLAQQLRTHCDRLNVIIPYHSYSGGTVISLAGDVIFMGSCSRISPIDVQIGRTSKDTFPVINFDKVVEFIQETARSFDFEDEANTAKMATELTTCIMQEIGPINIGELYRLRSLHWYYAKKLLTSYMLKHITGREELADRIVKKLTSEVPSHQFDIDRHIARDFGINVLDLDEEVYQDSKKLINACLTSKRLGIICPFISDKTRMPYFNLWGDSNEKK